MERAFLLADRRIDPELMLGIARRLASELDASSVVLRSAHPLGIPGTVVELISSHWQRIPLDIAADSAARRTASLAGDKRIRVLAMSFSRRDAVAGWKLYGTKGLEATRLLPPYPTEAEVDDSFRAGLERLTNTRFGEDVRLLAKSISDAIDASTPDVAFWQGRAPETRPVLGKSALDLLESCRNVDSERTASIVAAVAAAEAATHPMVRAALLGVLPRQRPPPPFHLGGPAPAISIAQRAAVAVWCAQTVADAETHAKHEALLARLQEGVAKPGSVPDAELDSASRLGRGHSPLRVIGLAARAVRRIATHPKEQIPSTDTAAMAVLAAANPEAFIQALDAELVRVEWDAFFAPRAPRAQGRLARLLWRGHDGSGALGHVIASLADSTIGILTKSGRKWQWFEGERDDVLATVPDDQFAAAARQVLVR